MHALLSIREGQFTILLQQIYYSPRCSYFYITLLALSFLLILVTIVDGFQVADSPLFISLELVLNLCVGVDFACRLKLARGRSYFVNQSGIRYWNVFDAFVVVVCNVLFAFSLVAKQASGAKNAEEGTEEALLVLWAVWQTLRIILIAKKQRLA